MNYIENFILETIAGNLRRGGIEAVGLVEGDTDLLSYGDHVRLAGKSLAEYDDIDFRAYFDGHVMQVEPMQFDALRSSQRVRVGTANFLMRGLLQSIGATEQGSPANPHQFAVTMRISDVFDHIVKEHCNFIYNATIAPDGIITETSFNTSDTAVTRLNVHRADDFWSALLQQLSGGDEGGVQFHWPWFNRFNKFFYQPSPLFMSLTSRGTLTKEHLRGRVRVTVRNQRVEDEIGQVEIVAAASDNSFFEAYYPDPPGDGRIIRKGSGIWADSQGQADSYATNLYLWLTRPYTLQIEVDPGLILFGDDGQGLDLGDRVTVTYAGPAEDAITGAGVALDINQDFYVYEWACRNMNSDAPKGSLTLEAHNEAA